MKRYALIVTLLMCFAASFAFAQDARFSNTRQLPPKGVGQTPLPAIMTGGDTFGSATVIPGLPYSDVGYTCNYANDYTPSCLTSSAPDVVYAYTPATDVCVDISLCGSGYDTAIHIYANNPSTPVACQDDSPDCGLQSHMTSVSLLAGNTYYIVIDGYSSNCGDYALEMSECPPPPVCPPCPANGIAEGEPVCADSYIDAFNGGCNSTPPVFSNLYCSPNQSVCGTYGTYNFNGSRDTDWYEITLAAPTTLVASVAGGGLTGSAIAILDNSCPPNVYCGEFDPGPQCGLVTCSAALGAGTYRIFVASFFDNTPCGTPYVLTVSGPDCPTPVNTKTWGTLKARYR